MTAKGLITFEELEEKLLGLEEARKTAERELQSLRGHRERLEELERDKDALLESYAGMAPEALGSLTPEERHQIYRMLRLKVMGHIDGTFELSGTLVSTPDVGNLETVCSQGLFYRTRREERVSGFTLRRARRPP